MTLRVVCWVTDADSATVGRELFLSIARQMVPGGVVVLDCQGTETVAEPWLHEGVLRLVRAGYGIEMRNCTPAVKLATERALASLVRFTTI